MLFTADHDEPRRALQKFIAAEINPHVDQWEQAGQFPSHELFKKLGGLGFLGLNKPVEFGGQGLDYSYALMRSGCRPTWRRRRWRGSAPTQCAANS
jgi:citronellyl-CoA dehydrogenase